MQRNCNRIASPGQGFVNGVVYNFVDQVMQGTNVGPADIHTWPAADMLHAFQVLNCFLSVLQPVRHNFLPLMSDAKPCYFSAEPPSEQKF